VFFRLPRHQRPGWKLLFVPGDAEPTDVAAAFKSGREAESLITVVTTITSKHLRGSRGDGC
jgi:hypothetical protein